MNTDVILKLQHALELHKNGDYAGAKPLYEEIIKIDPESHRAYYFLGLIYADERQPIQAAQFIQKAFDIFPEYEYLNILSNLYFEISDFKKAEICLKSSIQINPNVFENYFKLGIILYRVNDIFGAIEAFKSGLAINSGIPQPYYDLGVLYDAVNDHQNAVLSYKNAIRLNPAYKEAYYNLGVILEKLNRNREAFECFKKAEELGFQDYRLYFGIGNSKLALGDIMGAQEYFKKSFELNPDYVEAINGLGITFFKQGNYEKAGEMYKEVIEKKPDFKGIYNNIGTLYRDINKMDKAFEYLRKGIELDPESPENNYNLGTLCLLHKEFEEGWQRYESRFNLKEENPPIYGFSQPAWDGSSLENKTIYVYFEQGLGDTIMFARYLPVLKSKGAKILFKPQDSLCSVLDNNIIGAEILKTPPSSPERDFDFHSHLLSLPLKLGVTDWNVPFYDEKYVFSDSQKADFYKEKYFNTEKLKVGIFWQGNNQGMKNRSIKLEYLRELFALENVQYYSFQKGYGAEQLDELHEKFSIIELGSTFNDFSDTAAALENIDILITIDTAIAHLAGAMQKQVWLMLPYVPEWRWGLSGTATPWYRSLRLFRQKALNDWSTVISEIKTSLKSDILKI
jgi:tetratricopeptide (TPR) repeat protein